MAFAFKKRLTLSAGQSGTADSQNWPLTIGLGVGQQSADPDLKTVGNGGSVQSANGYDIAYFSDSLLNNRLAAERVFYDASTGRLEAHVKIPNLSVSANTVIYIAFGDSTIVTDPNLDATFGTTSVWDTNYKQVFHLPDGSSLSAKNSITGGNGTINNAGAVTGNIDGGASFNGTNANILGGDPGITTTPLTIEGWMYASVGDNVSIGLMDSAGGYNGWYMYVDPSFNINATQVFNNFSQFSQAVKAGSQNVWEHFAMVFTNNTSRTAYVNASPGATDTVSVSSPSTAPNNFVMGDLHINGTDGSWFTGNFDEVRISNVARTSSWITASYNSQKASSNFITWGPREQAKFRQTILRSGTYQSGIYR